MRIFRDRVGAIDPDHRGQQQGNPEEPSKKKKKKKKKDVKEETETKNLDLEANPAACDTSAHAAEYKQVVDGTCVVEPTTRNARLAAHVLALHDPHAVYVRPWESTRPLEGAQPGAPLVPPPTRTQPTNSRAVGVRLSDGPGCMLRRPPDA